MVWVLAMVVNENAEGTGVALCQQEILRAIIEDTDDAILSNDLDGIVTSWNKAAEELLGYAASEILGRSVDLLIAEDQRSEQVQLMHRILSGERVRHFQTVRRHKNGRLVPISLTVSALRNKAGEIVGASKIARDISDLQELQESQRLLIGEMQHRIKNVFALAGSLVGLSASRMQTAAEMAQDVRKRLRALAVAHELTVPVMTGSGLQARMSTFRGAVQALLTPYLLDGDIDRVTMTGPDLTLSGKAVTPIALLVNELITNAMKHGALRDGDGTIAITTAREVDTITIRWEETHQHMQPEGEMQESGFGSKLSRLAVERQLGGTLLRQWRENGLVVTVTFSADHIADAN